MLVQQVPEVRGRGTSGCDRQQHRLPERIRSGARRSWLLHDKGGDAFVWRYSGATCRVSLELRVEHLRELDLSSMLRPATTIETMLTNLRTPTFIAEATSVALDLPFWHSFDPKRQPGYVLALAGRCAR